MFKNASVFIQLDFYKFFRIVLFEKSFLRFLKLILNDIKKFFFIVIRLEYFSNNFNNKFGIIG